jgi:hypothetical protein
MNMAEKMALQGLTSFIVTYCTDFDDDPSYDKQVQFWADDAQHAREQFKDAFPDNSFVCAETQEKYESRVGYELDYGRKENV